MSSNYSQPHKKSARSKGLERGDRDRSGGGSYQSEREDSYSGGGSCSGSLQQNPIEGTTGSDTLVGTAGNDTIYGNGGNDNISGGGGNDKIVTGSGNDIINGSNDLLLGMGEKDILTGGGGKDTFILGSSAGAYYVGGGNNDFAKITDFTIGQDKLQLAGTAADYSISFASGIASIFYIGAGGADLIAQLSGGGCGGSTLSGLTLTDTPFTYVPLTNDGGGPT